MSLSFYDCSVASFLQTLGGVKNAMERGAATAADSALDLEALVNFRLHEDMLPFSFQVVSVWHHSLGAMKGLSAGLFEPPPKLGELGYSDLLGLVDEAIAMGAPSLWTQLDVRHPEAEQKALDNRLNVVIDKCPAQEWPRLEAGGLI